MPNALEGLSQLFGLRGVQRNSKEGGGETKEGANIDKNEVFFCEIFNKMSQMYAYVSHNIYQITFCTLESKLSRHL